LQSDLLKDLDNNLHQSIIELKAVRRRSTCSLQLVTIKMKTVSVQTGFTKEWFDSTGTSAPELLDNIKGISPTGITVLKVTTKGILTLAFNERAPLLAFVKSMLALLGEQSQNEAEDFTDDIMDRAS
jgi:hypothetical protein